LQSLPILVSRNGELIPPAEASVSVFNPALSGAFAVYESFQVVDGWPFALMAHLERLAHSAELIGLALPADLLTIASWSTEVLQANQAADCVLRLFVFGPENGGQAAAFIWPQPSPIYPEAFYTLGAPAITFEGQRAMPQAKTLNGLVSGLAQRQARAAGVHEALLYHNGQLTEGSNSNLFAVLDGVLLTPPTEMVLSGVARDAVLKVAVDHSIPVRQERLLLADVQHWSECFITSTSRHVMPISTIDGNALGDGRVGPTTRQIMALFEEHFRQVLAEEPPIVTTRLWNRTHAMRSGPERELP
jgi:branched-chain amino acid aminotransferase